MLELLISVLIFSLVVLAIYFLFDQGQWLYLHSQKRAHIQENARLVMEQMERDFRMIGAGVPSGGSVDDGTVWTPNIFTASDGTIGFTADIDNGTRELTADAGSIDDSHIFIGDPPNYYSLLDTDSDSDLEPDLPIVLVSNRKIWDDLIATSLGTASLITSENVSSPSTFTANKSTVHTLERIFYRMVNQAGSVEDDGLCTDPYPFCRIERQEYITNDPTETDPEAEAWGADWITVSTNVTVLEFKYYNPGNPDYIDPATDPLNNVHKISIFLRCRDRASRAGQYQNSDLRTQVLIRNSQL